MYPGSHEEDVTIDVFQLRDNVIHNYAQYVRSFVQIREHRLSEFVEQSLTDEALWPQPLIQMNPSFEPGGSSGSESRGTTSGKAGSRMA